MPYLPLRSVRFETTVPKTIPGPKPEKFGGSSKFPLSEAAQYVANLRIYKNLCDYLLRDTFLKRAVSPNTEKAWDLYYTCLLAIKNIDPVASLIVAQEMRIRLLEVSTLLDLSSTPELLQTLRRDDTTIGKLLIRSLSDTKDKVLSLKDQEATKFLNLMQYILDKDLVSNDESRAVHRFLVKLSEASDILPHTVWIEGVTLKSTHAVACGGFADIYRGRYEKREVALKRLIIREEHKWPDIRRVFLREALVWQQLRHPNILPFLGVALPAPVDRDSDEVPSSISRSLCMVSPWMGNGTIRELRRVNGAYNIDIPRRILEISRGLAYLHSEGIIHGDLRGSNILVDDFWHACLADFGLTCFNNATSSRTSNRRGSARWMAPELFTPNTFNMRFKRTKATDTYAFACVCLEIYTGADPFIDMREETMVMLQVIQGFRPDRPTGHPQEGGDIGATATVSIDIPDSTWALLERCWTQEPGIRPKISDVLADLETAQN